MNMHNNLPSHERDEPIYTPPSGPPQTDGIPPAVYQAMGEENIIAFFHAFYRRLGESSVADMFTFLFGGPHLYNNATANP